MALSGDDSCKGLVPGWLGLLPLSGWLPDPRTEAVHQPLGFSFAWSSAHVFRNMTVLSFLAGIACSWLLNRPLVEIAEVAVMRRT